MNINCIICSDLFTPMADTYSTQCGHMFHYLCLMQWLERSQTCPQCRCKVTEKTIHRMYFNLQSTEGIVDDVGQLQHKVDNLTYQLKLRDKDVKINSDKYKNSKSQNAVLREEVKTLEGKMRTAESGLHALKEQILYYKQKSQENTRMAEEVQRLKDKIRNMDNMRLVLEGSREQVNEMLRHNSDPEALNLLVATLKKELTENDRKRRLQQTKLAHAHNESLTCKRELDELKKEYENLRSNMESHTKCELRQRQLKNKISQLESKLDSGKNSDVEFASKEILSGSFNASVIDLSESLSVEERVQLIKNSESPYLPIKPNSAIPSLLTAKFSVASSTQAKPSAPIDSYTLLSNKQSTKFSKKSKSHSDIGYDGLGGTSKVETFPQPNRQAIALKRQKSSTSYTASSKFRKLGSNKKMDDFVSQL